MAGDAPLPSLSVLIRWYFQICAFSILMICSSLCINTSMKGVTTQAVLNLLINVHMKGIPEAIMSQTPEITTLGRNTAGPPPTWLSH